MADALIQFSNPFVARTVVFLVFALIFAVFPIWSARKLQRAGEYYSKQRRGSHWVRRADNPVQFRLAVFSLYGLGVLLLAMSAFMAFGGAEWLNRNFSPQPAHSAQTTSKPTATH